MLQIEFLESILKLCKESGLHTAVDTAGNVPFDDFQRIAPCTDLFLYDIKCITDALHMEGTGSSDRLILENLEKLSGLKRNAVWVRIPIIPGFNTSKEELKKIASFLAPLSGVARVELLPYHRLGGSKLTALGLTGGHGNIQPPSGEDMAHYAAIMKENGVNI